MNAEFPEFPIVICDELGVVDRVASEQEAAEYIASMPGESLTFFDAREEAS